MCRLSSEIEVKELLEAGCVHVVNPNLIHILRLFFGEIGSQFWAASSENCFVRRKSFALNDKFDIA